jgi:hypothetical protein
MDEKTINLWRQIESCRRRERKPPERGKRGAAPARQGA